MLATFLIAVLIKRVNGKAMNIGLVVGVLFNMSLWIFVPQIFWFWWNFIGCLITLAVAVLMSYVYTSSASTDSDIKEEKFEIFTTYNLILLISFLSILAFCLYLPHFL